MSIIDFGTKYTVYDLSKTRQERALDFYNKNIGSLSLHIGDSVKIKIPSNCPQDLRTYFENKQFKIVEVDMDFNVDNPLSYILNTGIDIKSFKDNQLTKCVAICCK